MKLSGRELTIAERYAEGETYKEIAGKLHIAPATVRNHLAAIYRKLEVKNKPELIRALPALEKIIKTKDQQLQMAAIAAMGAIDMAKTLEVIASFYMFLLL